MVFAAVIAVYLFFRKSAPATQTQPSTSASGLPLTTPQAQNYNVAPYQQTPNPLVMLAEPQSNDPGSGAQKPPSYLAFNFGPSHDLTKTPTASALREAQRKANSGCGGSCGTCKSRCNSSNVFPDGNGNTEMSSDRKRQIEAQPSWIDNALANLADSGSVPTMQPLSGGDVPTAQIIPASVANSVSRLGGVRAPDFNTIRVVDIGQNPASHPYTMLTNFAASPYLN